MHPHLLVARISGRMLLPGVQKMTLHGPSTYLWDITPRTQHLSDMPPLAHISHSLTTVLTVLRCLPVFRVLLYKSQVTSLEEDEKLCSKLTEMIKELQIELSRLCVAARVMEFYFVHLVCDDPTLELVQPVLQLMRGQLVTAARRHASKQADKIAMEMIRLEEVRVVHLPDR